MTAFEITDIGDPVLLKQAAPVEDPTSPEITDLIAGMNATLDKAGGLGLAAPQVDRSLRLFLMESRPTASFPGAEVIPRQAVINPEILMQSESVEIGWEGCLSIPAIRARISRPTRIRARWVTCDHRTIEKELSGLAARVFLHEYDHLDGTLIFDRVKDTSDIYSISEFEKRSAQS